MHFNFEPPPRNLSILACVGGVATAMLAIVGLRYWSNHLTQTVASPQPEVNTAQTTTSEAKTDPKITAKKLKQEARFKTLAKLDGQSVQLPGTQVTEKELTATKTPYIPPKVTELSSEELAVANQAWQYFEENWNDETGLVNSVDGFTSVTLWDQGAAIAALVSAKELGIISEEEFTTKMSQTLKTLAKLPLYKEELPNKVYNSQTLMPVDYGQLNEEQEIGWSAIDLGRMAIWLKIVGTRYPKFRQQTETVWKSWDIERLTKDGHMYGTAVVNGKEQYNQEGRLGYENYAAFGLKLWGLEVEKALDSKEKAAFVNLYNVGIPYDIRDYHNSEANNYVLSEPYFLDGIETGFQALPKAYADRILAAQEARYKATKQLTAITEDNLDRAPYFVYSTLFANGKPWATITDTRENHNNLRFVSTKAAIGWHVLYNTNYTKKLFDFVTEKLIADEGWYNGFYETLQEPNKSLTANNNGVILESLLYKQVGKPLTVWAGVKTPK
ncbi:MAG: DUF3131 domain-containing protein [Coleofasciculaceae cyanobacterium]